MSELIVSQAASPLLRDVERAYAIGDKVAALGEVFAGGAVEPFEVFRWHLEKPWDVVSGQDVVWREEMDLLLSALSALHIGGLQAAGVPIGKECDDNPVWHMLCHPAVTAYYEKHYPLAPPLLVRAAGEGRLPSVYSALWQGELAHDGFVAAYRQFLHLDARFIANNVIGDFIALLDDYIVAETHIELFRRVLEDPERLKKWLAEPGRWELLEGMESFYEFAIDLDAFLAGLSFPILRGHVWLHFAYWFGNGGERMEAVAQWLESAAAKAQDDETGYSTELGEALTRLRDPMRYPIALIAHTADVLEPWLESSGVGAQLSATS
jgi:hypothetical protein